MYRTTSVAAAVTERLYKSLSDRRLAGKSQTLPVTGSKSGVHKDKAPSEKHSRYEIHVGSY